MLYYPALVASIKLAFDESVYPQAALIPKSVEQVVAEGNKKSQNLIRELSFSPLALQKGNESFINNRVPKKAQLMLPGYRQAATFNLTFDFREIPIDPRAVRAAAVDIHMGTVSAQDFARGMETAQLVNGRKFSSLDTSRFFFPATSETLVMTGLVDEWDVDHSNTSTVTLRGRDIRGALIDTPIAVDPKQASKLLDKLDFGQPVDVVVKQIIGFDPLFADIGIEVNAAEWPRGEVPTPGADAMPRHRKGAKGKKTGGRASSGSTKMSIWDLVVKTCYLVGAVPFIQGTDLIIRPARSLYDQKRGRIRGDAPFAAGQPRVRDSATGEWIKPFRVRKLVYGRDVTEMSLNRKYGGYQRPIRVRCTGSDSSSTARGLERIVQGVWPPFPEKPKGSKVAPGRKAAKEELVNIPVAGISDPSRLATIAQAIYEEIGRGEAGGKFQTRNLASFGGDNADPDLLRLRVGDAVELLSDTRLLRDSAPLISELTENQRTPLEQQIELVAKRLGGDKLLARVIVTTARGETLQRVFRTSSVSYEFGETGISVTAEFQNYVEKIFDGGGNDDTGLPGTVKRR